MSVGHLELCGFYNSYLIKALVYSVHKQEELDVKI